MTTPFREGAVKGYLHQPSEPNGDALILTHGAGGDCTMALLVAVADVFAESGFVVLRCDLVFRQHRKFGPPSPANAAADREGLKDAVTVMRRMVDGRVFLGGQSYGGRMASILAAEKPGLASALLLLAYPLHPPAKPTQLRTAHFPQLKTPALFVHGSKDGFATSDELQAATQLIPARTAIEEIEGAGHDLRQGRFAIREKVLGPLLAIATHGGGGE